MATKTHKPNTDLISENGMGRNLVERLREKSRLRTEVVHVDRWEINVTIGELSSKEMRDMRVALEKEYPDGKINPERAAVYAIAHSCIDPAFSVADLELLMGDDLSNQPMRQIGEAVMRLNRMGEDGVKQAENSFPDTEGRGQ